ncbi:MAG: hypothetical protein FJX74_16275 [Armatimonadetes bacterium]|nr:hypothetical protein [Armatimonadota bacterium]
MERRAQDIAITTIQSGTSVREVYRWGRTLVEAGDDWGSLQLSRIASGGKVSPAMRHWLSDLRKEIDKQWKDRAERHDRDARWDD